MSLQTAPARKATETASAKAVVTGYPHARYGRAASGSRRRSTKTERKTSARSVTKKKASAASSFVKVPLKTIKSTAAAVLSASETVGVPPRLTREAARQKSRSRL